jgi:hypothetical protein
VVGQRRSGGAATDVSRSDVTVIEHEGQGAASDARSRVREPFTREEAIRRLPEPYAVALRLQGAGVTDVQLAAALDVAREAVPGLLRIAEAKLAEVLSDASEAPSP